MSLLIGPGAQPPPLDFAAAEAAIAAVEDANLKVARAQRELLELIRQLAARLDG